MVSLQQKIGALGAPAKLALGALAATAVSGGYYFLSTYEACEGCKRRREAMKAAFKNGNLSAPTAGQSPAAQPRQEQQPQHQGQ